MIDFLTTIYFWKLFSVCALTGWFPFRFVLVSEDLANCCAACRWPWSGKWVLAKRPPLTTGKCWNVSYLRGQTEWAEIKFANGFIVSLVRRRRLGVDVDNRGEEKSIP